jgi:hypothetical protein
VCLLLTLGLDKRYFQPRRKFPPAGTMASGIVAKLKDGSTISCHCNDFYEVKTEIAIRRFPRVTPWSLVLRLRREFSARIKDKDGFPFSS